MRITSSLGLLSLAACASLSPLTRAVAAGPLSNYVVFFQEWSAAIDQPASAVIEAAAKAAQADPKATVLVAGFADPKGSAQANIYLSELRAQVVADQLQHDGLPADRIKQTAAGSVAYEFTRQESRRVVISISH
jgi:outer membrane protein OmpA-like peptidoglycan-associated protein